MLTRTGLAAISALTLMAAAGAALGQALQDSVPTAQPPMQPGQAPAPGTATPTKLPDGSDSASKIEFTQSEFDFGRISDQGEVHTKFQFKNNGTGKLVFKTEQKASCGCTVGKPRSPKNPNVDQFEFAPGEEGYIEVKFSAHGKRGDIQQRVTIQSYDPFHQPEGPVLTIRAKVKPTITFDPPSIGFGDVMVGQQKKEIIKINGAKPEFEVPYLSTSKGRFVTTKVLETKQIEIDGEKVGQSTVELTIDTTSLPRGKFDATATVRTNDPQYWLAEFPITASIVGDLQVLPPRLSVGVIETNTPFSKTFRVTSRSGAPFKITKIEQQQNATPLDVSFEPVDPANPNAYTVKVNGAGIATPMQINSALTIFTDSTTDPMIDMVLSGAVRGTQQPGTTTPMPPPAPGVYTPMPNPAAPK